MTSKRVLVAAAVLSWLMLIQGAPPGHALPGWWNHPDFQTSGGGQFTRPLASDPPSGSLEIWLDNVYVPTLTKELYFVLDWKSTDPVNSRVEDPVWFSWESPVHHYHTYGQWFAGNQLVSQYNPTTGWYHLEYNYFVFPQPDEEWARIDWGIATPGNTIDYTYDFRTNCIPEPASGLLLGAGLIGVGLGMWRRKARR